MKKGYEFSEMCGASVVMIFQDEKKNNYFYHSQRSHPEAKSQLSQSSTPHDELDLLKANPLHKFLNLDYLSRADPYLYRPWSDRLPDKVVFDLKKHKKLSDSSISEPETLLSSPAPEDVQNEGCM